MLNNVQNKTNLPKVSIVIPIYNVEQYLERSLDSVINQTYKNLEIICVNDCSKDNSSKILDRYSKKDKRIKIVNRLQNGGLSAARNSGLEITTGKYVYFLDSDDWIDLDYIECMLNAALFSKAEVVLNTNILTHNATKPLYQHMPDYTYNNIENEFINAKNAILNILWNTWAHLWKKDFLDKINAKFPEGYIIEDIYFQAITYAYLDKIYVIRNSAYHYSIRDASIMGNLKKDSFCMNLKILNKIIDYYEENNIPDSFNIKSMFYGIYPNTDNRKQFEELRKYFSRIKTRVENNRKLYTKLELALFDNVLNNIDKAMHINYANLYVFEKLRKNIMKTKTSVI